MELCNHYKNVVLILCGVILLCYQLHGCEAGQINAPIELYRFAGCANYSCEPGYYSSPAIVQAGKGLNDTMVVAGTSFVNFYSSNGTILNIFRASVSGLIWSDIAIVDLPSATSRQVVAGFGGGVVGVYHLNGTAYPNFPNEAYFSDDIRSVVVTDLDNDGSFEIVLGRSSSGRLRENDNVWVINSNAVVRSPWPMPENDDDGDESYGGVDNSNIAVANIDANPNLEIIVPAVGPYVAAYNNRSQELRSSLVFNSDEEVWSSIQFCLNASTEKTDSNGCPCSSVDGITDYRADFGNSPATVADVDGDGTKEIIVVGNVKNFCSSNETSQFQTIFILNADRTRWSNSKYNWSEVPNPQSIPNLKPPLSSNFQVIENVMPNPVLADLDGDGELEILYSSYDGKLHVFWLDQSQHCGWPFTINYLNLPYILYSSPPIVADLDNDGLAEVIITTWAETATGDYGSLIILDWAGNVLHDIKLPKSKSCMTEGECDTWGGGLASPSIGNIDDTPDMEIVVQTHNAGLVAYTIPNSANARLLWSTGRANYARTGELQLTNRSRGIPPVCPCGGEKCLTSLLVASTSAVINVTESSRVELMLDYDLPLVRNDTRISRIGSIFFRSDTLNSSSSLMTVQAVPLESLKGRAYNSYASGLLISPIISVVLNDAPSTVRFNKQVNIELIIPKSVSQEHALVLGYIQNDTWVTEDTSLFESTESVEFFGTECIYIVGRTYHFTSFAILIEGPPASSTTDGDGNASDGDGNDGDGEDGDGGDGLSDGAMAGIIIGCVVGALLVVVIVIVIVIIVVLVQRAQHKKADQGGSVYL